MKKLKYGEKLNDFLNVLLYLQKEVQYLGYKIAGKNNQLTQKIHKVLFQSLSTPIS